MPDVPRPHAARSGGAIGAFGALDDDTNTSDAEAWSQEVVDSPREGQVVQNRYVLICQISKGAVGQVWRAQDKARQADVALKIVPRLGPQLWERFRREASIAEQVRGPHFAVPFDYGENDALAWFAMELLDGEDLARRLDRERQLSPLQCVELVDALTTGIAVAHKAGIVHRDLKPKNVFIERGPKGGEQVKILDFGIAKHAAIAARVTRSGVLLGTPHYMSPEQVTDVRRVDHRADLWSIAAIAYRCLLGRRPFEGDLSELLLHITHSPFAQPTQLAPRLHPAIDAFFERALAKAPADRFPDARSLALAFRQALSRRS